MKGKVILPKVSIRGFPPRTYGEHDVAKKAQVRDLLRAKIPDLEALKAHSRGRRLKVEITFYLYQKSLPQGRATKDIDNMFKIVIDALPDYMDRGRSEPGLGLIEDVNDDMVFGLCGAKIMVDTEPEEGIDIEISEWVN